MDSLYRFYSDEHMREQVRDFFLAHLDSLALSKVYSELSTAGIVDAKNSIENAFIALKKKYEPNSKKEENIR